MPLTKKTIVFVSTFPPRECGLATFTADLIAGFEKIFSPFITTKVIAVNDKTKNYYLYSPQHILFEINQDTRSDYREAARVVNQAAPAVVCVQHEFGIFGGTRGAYIVDFLKDVAVPRVIILHTVLPSPLPPILKRMQELHLHSELFVVMTKNSQKILVEDYGIPQEKIHIIPHGVPEVVFEFSGPAKKNFALNPHKLLTTFGLLSRNKGIEYVLRSLPAVIAKHPDVLYLIIGATHPKILQKEGEQYRKMLFTEVKRLGLTKHVRFYNKYFDLKSLIQILKMTDIYIATSLDPHQAVSGTLSYALGIGRPVIATKFSQAEEFVTPTVGRLVPVKDPAAYGRAALELLAEPQTLHTMAYNAYSQSRVTTWSNVANAYYRTFVSLAPSLALEQRRLFPLKLSHFDRMTTKTGILQFCQLAIPNEASGYTLDDNARALFAMALYYRESQSQRALQLAEIYLKFVLTRKLDQGHLLNIFFFDGTPDIRANQESREDAHTRALYALAYVGTLSTFPVVLRSAALKKFDALLREANTYFTFPRAQALFIKALYAGLQRRKMKEETRVQYQALIDQNCQALVEQYRRCASHEWEWFESALTYSNGLLSEALFIGFAVTSNPEYLKVAQKTLAFLMQKSFLHGQVWPVGQNGWLRQGGERQYFDQQPEELTALLSCLRTALDCTEEREYQEALDTAFSWFVGNNALGQMMYDEATGGCFDGLTPTSVNLNQGSESTLCYLIARLSMVRGPLPFAKQNSLQEEAVKNTIRS